ncbi:hypothetical protein WMY93_002804 [Mugilogobius chulae]|uniref:Uncharacterized protein n=1 Tax=Mugilogobius chulae TaxID=88201 RepID=A0AAW0PWF6_9GOBI
MGSFPYKQKLKYADCAQLPSYREAILQNAAALRRSSSTLVHRRYSSYLNSYTDYPVYVAPNHFYDGSKDTCHLFPCASHCPGSNTPVLQRVSNQPVVYQHNSLYGAFDGGAGPREEPGGRDRRPVLVARRVNSPYVPKPWSRVSSLESERRGPGFWGEVWCEPGIPGPLPASQTGAFVSSKNRHQQCI